MAPTKNQTFIIAYGDYEKALLKHSTYKVSDPELAADLVQITYLKTWEYLVKNGKIDTMKGFLFHILNNLIIDEYRKKKPVSLDILSDAGYQIVVDDTHSLYDLMDAKKAVILIPQLGKTYREVMTMHFIHDLSIQEISEATNKSRNTVAVQIHRGVDKLAILFKNM